MYNRLIYLRFWYISTTLFRGNYSNVLKIVFFSLSSTTKVTYQFVHSVRNCACVS